MAKHPKIQVRKDNTHQDRHQAASTLPNTSTMGRVRSIFSVSCASSVLMAFYLVVVVVNLYRLMYPLAGIDISTVPKENFVKPLWQKGDKMHMRVYLSTRPSFNYKFLDSEYEAYDDEGSSEEDSEERKRSTVQKGDVALLWDEMVDSPAFSKSFLLTSVDCSVDSAICENDESYKFASSWLDHAEKRAIEHGEGGVLSVVSAAGHGIESTSILLTLYQSVWSKIRSILSALSITAGPSEGENKEDAHVLQRAAVKLSPAIWSSLHSNSTIYVHVLLLRAHSIPNLEDWPPSSLHNAKKVIQSTADSYSLLVDRVELIKFESPHHLSKPGRILYHDLLYLWKKYIMGSTAEERPPWNMASSKPDEYAKYQGAMQMKKLGTGYPYFKPEVAIKYVNDQVEYPLDLVRLSGLPLARVRKSYDHPTGVSYTPAIHVDEIGLTSEKYIPVNETITSLPLRISFDRSDIEHRTTRTTATAGGMSPARWRLLSQLSQGIESQKKLGFDQSDIDDLRRLIADTNVTLLAITMLASALHLLFEFLTFKNEVSFWSKNKDLTGLSVRSLFLDMTGQTVILFYLFERDSSLLITVPSTIGCLIALWKCKRAAGLQFVRVTSNDDSTQPVAWWNWIPRRLFGYELRATRLEVKKSATDGKGPKPPVTDKDRLTALTIESDRIATRTLGAVLLPLVLGYTFYSFVREEHTGWYSWLITSASSAVYALGFVLMTPQLFLNWKLKSVAHLPWRVLVYKSLNTFIDDLFSFIIRMPTMARISCFRDDVVFFIYLYQRWLYPVDESRPVEGGASSMETTTATRAKKNQ